MTQGKRPAHSKRQKDLILKALTDATFRKQLETEPQKALGLKAVDATKKKEIGHILALVRDIESKITALSDELLCANGPCGIARV